MVSDRVLLISNKSVPSLATAGTGDILSGLIGGFLAQSMPPIQAASTAISIHAESGLLAQNEIGTISTKASDILNYLPDIINQITKKNQKIL